MQRRMKVIRAAGVVSVILVSQAAQATIVALDVNIVLDKISPDEKNLAIGQHHEARVFYDDSKVDPATHRVAILHEQHTPALIPKHLNPAQMPMSNGWLDLSGPVILYHYAAAPTTAFPFPYFVLFDEKTQRMTIRRQSDGVLLLSGPYKVDPKKITGPEIDAVVASSDPVVPPWETAMPIMPARAAGSPGVTTGKLTTSSSYGDLLDNPKTKAVLVQLIPDIVNNPQSQMGRGMPLKDLSQFEPSLTPQKLAQIDASLAKAQ